MELRVETDPDPADLDLIEEGVRAAAAAAAVREPESDLTVLARENGQVVAGITGWTWADCCELVSLWVDDAHRGCGVGSVLIRKAEEEARARGCTTIVIFVYSFQPVALYERLGYHEVGRVEDFPSGSDAVFMVKRLTPTH